MARVEIETLRAIDCRRVRLARGLLKRRARTWALRQLHLVRKSMLARLQRLRSLRLGWARLARG